MLDWLEMPSDDRDADGAADLTEDVRRAHPAERLVAEGERLYYEGEFTRAAAEFARARRHDPLLFEAWAAESEALVRSGDLAAADAAASRALKAYGRVPLFYAAKAIVLAHQGYIRAAYEHSDVSVREHGSSLFTWLSRAEVVLAADRKEAIGSVLSCFGRALALDPTRWQVRFRCGLILFDWGHVEPALDRFAETAKTRPANPFLWKLLGDCRRRLGQNRAARACYEQALARRPDYPLALDALHATTLWGRLCAGLARVFRREAGT